METPVQQDAAFKWVFSHPVTIERLVRAHAPERAAVIDFSTLEKIDSELVGEALVRRYPDMLWRARRLDGTGDVVVNLEFQGRQDRFMAVRIAIYALLAAQGLLRRKQLARAGRSLEVLSFVIHHGGGRWTAPTNLRKIFTRWVPGDYRVISPEEPEEGKGAAGVRDELPRTILQLERERSVEGTLAHLRALQRLAGESGSEYDRFMAGCIAEMLVSKGRVTRERMKGATTMAQVDIEYQRSLEEFGRKWFRQGRDEGKVALLRDLVSEKFGSEGSEGLSAVLQKLRDPARISLAATAVIECDTPEEFFERVRRESRG